MDVVKKHSGIPWFLLGAWVDVGHELAGVWMQPLPSGKFGSTAPAALMAAVGSKTLPSVFLKCWSFRTWSRSAPRLQRRCNSPRVPQGMGWVHKQVPSGWTVVRRRRYEYVFYLDTVTLFFECARDPSRSLPPPTVTLMSPLSQCTLIPLCVSFEGSPTRNLERTSSGPVDDRERGLLTRHTAFSSE